MRNCQALPVRDLIRNCTFIRDLSDAVVQEIADCISLKTVAPGQCIFLKGDPGKGLYAIASGRVKATSISEEGKEIILNTFGSGDVFGEIALLEGGTRSANATAVVDSTLAFLSRGDFLRVLEAHPASAISLLKVVADRLRRTTEQLEERAFADFEVRLARALIKMRVTGGGAQPIVPMTQQQLGDVIGLSREGTNRLLRSWERRKVVSLRPGHITICSVEALYSIGQLEHD